MTAGQGGCLFLGLRIDYGDHAHLRRIDEHNLIIHLGELEELGFGVVSEEVVRQRVEVNMRFRVVNPLSWPCLFSPSKIDLPTSQPSCSSYRPRQ